MRAAALVLPLLLTGCVEPTVGERSGFARSADPGFPVRVVPPAEAPRPTVAAGSLDGVSPGGATFLQGWAPSPEAELLVVTELPARLVHSVRVVRPDAAAAVGLPGADLGFRVLLRTSTERVCVLAALPDGSTAVLSGSDADWCPSP